MVVPVPPVVPIVVTIPMVVVLDSAAASLPVASVVHAALVSWSYPPRTRIRCASPITLVPLVMVSNRIPIAVNPRIAWTRANRGYPNNSRRGRADSHPDRDLSSGRGCAEQKHCSKRYCDAENSHTHLICKKLATALKGIVFNSPDYIP